MKVRIARLLSLVLFVVVSGVALLAAEKEKSGKAWCAKFKDKADLDDLESGFKENFKNFKKALEDGGVKTKVESVLRPKERAYLMHWAWRIVNKNEDAQKIPAMAKVDIDWWHGDQAKSKAAAQEMVDAFPIKKLKTEPPVESNHTKGKAADMTTSWSGNLKLKDGAGKDFTISSTPRDSTNKDLIVFAKSFKVIHFLKPDEDMNHWSVDGH